VRFAVLVHLEGPLFLQAAALQTLHHPPHVHDPQPSFNAERGKRSERLRRKDLKNRKKCSE
jgi:hypothetical protein